MKWQLKQAETGDMVRVRLGRIYHYGVFISEDEIIQFGLAPTLRQNVKDSDIEICISDVDTFLAGGFLEVAVFDRGERKKNRPASEVVKYARSQLGVKGYHILHNNCEHFAYECVTGKRYCSQTEGVRNFFGSLPMLKLYVAKIPEELCVCEVEPAEKNDELRAMPDGKEKCERYFEWKLLQYALERSICYRIKNLKLENGNWVSDKCKFDVCTRDGVSAVLVSRSDVSVEMLGSLDEVDNALKENCRVEVVTVGEKQYVFLVKNDAVGSLTVYSNLEVL